jgi:hypothetical protein
MTKRKKKISPPLKNKNNAGAASDTALVKFDPLQRYLAEISNYSLLTRGTGKGIWNKGLRIW